MARYARSFNVPFRWGDYAVMSEPRYFALMNDETLRLTSEELKEGWHFCADWDGLLICDDWPEMSGCACK